MALFPASVSALTLRLRHQPAFAGVRVDLLQRLQQALQVSDLDRDPLLGRVKVASWALPSSYMNKIKAARAIGAHAYCLAVFQRPLVKDSLREVDHQVRSAGFVPPPCRAGRAGLSALARF